MGYYVNDGHGLWSLHLLHGFNADGTIKRGCYFKKTSEADQAKPTVEVTASLLRLEDAEAVIAETDLVKRGDMIRQSKYRGAMIYAIVDDATVNLGSLFTRTTNALRDYALAYAETTGNPTHGEPEPGPHVLNPTPEEGVFDPADTDKDGVVSKSERKAWNKEHPNDPR